MGAAKKLVTNRDQIIASFEPMLIGRQELALDKIKVDHVRVQSRVQTHSIYIKKFADAMVEGTIFPDLIVFFDGKVYWLADGFHRHPAHNKAGHDSAWCRVYRGGQREAVLYSVSANLEFSIEITKEDKERAVRMMLDDEECFTWSDGEIGRRCGLQSSTARKIRSQYCIDRRINLPKMVKRFQIGTNKFSWVPYGNIVGGRDEPPRFRKSDKEGSYYYGTVKGKTVRLGSDPVKAQRRYDELLESKSKDIARALSNRPSLGNQAQFVNWLVRRMVDAQTVTENICSCFVLSGHICVVCPNENLDCLFAAVGRVWLAKTSRGKSEVMTIIGYFENPHLGLPKIKSILSNSGEVVRFLTPEQVVAEFGPRPDGPTAPDGQP